MKKVLTHIDKLNLPPQIEREDLYFVGGASRSILKDGILPKDIDLCGDFDISAFSQLTLENKQYIKQLHSLRFQSGEFDIDLTAFRKEEYKKGYFPSKVERVESAEIDSLRRDFTINAIYISKIGEIFDYHNGITHLQDKKLLQITDKTLQVDGMRIYRMVRFALMLGLEIERNTLECAMENKANIMQIAKHRGEVEFNKFARFITDSNIELIEQLGILDHLEMTKRQLIKT